MTKTSQEILELMRDIGLYPTMHGTPESVDGMFEALAAVVLREELQRPLNVALCDVAWYLVPEATKDVLRAPEQAPMLCEECCLPDRRSSFEAFRRHASLFLDLFENDLLRAKELVRKGKRPGA
jgi:hypothetical protein